MCRDVPTPVMLWDSLKLSFHFIVELILSLTEYNTIILQVAGIPFEGVLKSCINLWDDKIYNVIFQESYR